jgi:hypothetical protein
MGPEAGKWLLSHYHSGTVTDMATIRDSQDVPRRLVKLYLPVDVVRRMDAAIPRSDGAYLDRAEFVTEAIIDRLAEEELGTGPDASQRPAKLAAVPTLSPDTAAQPETARMFGDWLSSNSVPTLPITSGPGTNFGLHNRDYPTIWACDLLGRRTAELGEPIAWDRFSSELLQASWHTGRQLAAGDAAAGRPLKTSIGFPLNAAKKEAAERRFLAHAFGLPTARGNPGPVLVFKWVGVDQVDGRSRVALTDPGLALLRKLAATGEMTPPFTDAAWSAFVRHLAEHAEAELKAWFSVLALLRDQPNRVELIERCSWWRGNEAATNAMSYVSRGREWSLVEPRLDRDGRYVLTEPGIRELNRLDQLLAQGEAS